MARGRCISCKARTEATGGAGFIDQNDKRERHVAESAVNGYRVGYAVESDTGTVDLICSWCLPSLIAQAIRQAPTE